MKTLSLMSICFLIIPLTTTQSAASAAKMPELEYLADSLAWQMNAERVDVTALSYDEFKSRYLFPIKARLYSAWNGERPVRTPDFYDIRFIARKNDNRYVFHCTLRSYGSSYVGFGAIDTSPSEVILTNECTHRSRPGQVPPERAGLILSRPFNRVTVLFRAGPGEMRR